jgi:hypothetical protein
MERLWVKGCFILGFVLLGYCVEGVVSAKTIRVTYSGHVIPAESGRTLPLGTPIHGQFYYSTSVTGELALQGSAIYKFKDNIWAWITDHQVVEEPIILWIEATQYPATAMTNIWYPHVGPEYFTLNNVQRIEFMQDYHGWSNYYRYNLVVDGDNIIVDTSKLIETFDYDPVKHAGVLEVRTDVWVDGAVVISHYTAAIDSMVFEEVKGVPQLIFPLLLNY